MAFNWDDFLDLAEELSSRTGNEAAARSAISRAYYAVFHAGRDHLEHSAISLDRGRNAHLQVQEELRGTSEEIGRDLERLHVWRKKADCDNPSFDDIDEQAKTAVILARDTIAALKAIS